MSDTTNINELAEQSEKQRTLSLVELDLRDYFAAVSLQGLLSAQIHGFADSPANGPFASMAYEMADAMLRVREASND